MENEIMDNQVQELDYILPDDYEEEAEETTEADTEELEVGEEAEATEEESEVEDTLDETETVVAESLDDLEVKYLHEVKKLKDIPKEELKTIVQKGMNHDRIAEKFTLANEKLEKLNLLGSLYGMSDAEVVDALFNRYYEDTADKEGLRPEQVKARVEADQKATVQKMYDRFVSKFPDVKTEDVPKDVWEEVKLGEDLTRAYENHLKQSTISAKDSEITKLNSRLAELEGKLKTFTQNETVKKKAVVKPTSNNGSDEVGDDDFLMGLLGK